MPFPSPGDLPDSGVGPFLVTNCPQECYRRAQTILGQNTEDHGLLSRNFFSFDFHDLPSVEQSNESSILKKYLISLVLVALYLDCSARAFSSCGGWRVGWRGEVVDSISVLGFSLKWLLSLLSTGSRAQASAVAACGLLEHRLSSCGASA